MSQQQQPSSSNVWSSYRGKARGGSKSSPRPVPAQDGQEQSASSGAVATPTQAPPAPAVNPWGRPKEAPAQVAAQSPVRRNLDEQISTPAVNPWGRPKEAPAQVPAQSPVQVAAQSPVRRNPDEQMSTPASPAPGSSQRRDVQEVTQRVTTMTIQSGQVGSKSTRPRRVKETGKPEGMTSLSVRANHFGVSITPRFPKEIFHYDVVITPAEAAGGAGAEMGTLPDRILPLIWRQFQIEHHQRLLASTPFDGKKNCYTSKRLEFDGQDGFVTILKMADPDDPDKMRQFRVGLKLVSIVPTQAFWEFLRSGRSGLQVDLPQDIIQALDVALRVAPAMHYVACNRSFFSEMNSLTLDNLLELWSGHYQSLCLGCDEKATLNIDLATKAFYKAMPVTKFLRVNLKLSETDSMDLNAWDDSYIEMANECLKGKLIQYGTGEIGRNGKYEKYHKFTAVGLVKESARSYKFKASNGVMMSIEDYMKDVKGTNINNPHYPCLHIGSQKATNYVPLELAHIIPQAYRGKMEAQLTAKMIKGAAVGPKDRFERINNSKSGCKYEACEVLKEFGINVSNQMTEITDAKLLFPPKITTMVNNQKNSSTQVDPKMGSWQYKERSGQQRQFLRPAAVPKLGLLDLAGVHDRSLNEFLNTLSSMGEGQGMKGFKQMRSQVIYSRVERGRNLSENINRRLLEMKSKGVKLVIVVISSDGKEYAVVKAEAEVKVGMLTSCIKVGNVLNIKPQTLTNYLLKVNAKLNGGNWEVENLNRLFLSEPVIIFGADVTHPAPNSKAPSIAAVTASYNLNGMGFNMHIQPQASKQEVIDRVGEICEKMIRTFHQHTGQKPKRLIMFRDGVSEGYFDEIKSKEYEEIKKVCDRLSPDDPIKITFVVVKKRHHTRLQPMNSSNGVGKYFNVPPGTIVDTKIVHPTEQEFFLNSHVGIQGTSKPTRYHVIHDDNSFTMSRIQTLTYFLCYSFVRCTQPVSYPAATYYAHLAAYRARHLIEKEGENADLAALQRQLTIHPDLIKNYPMFFV